MILIMDGLSEEDFRGGGTSIPEGAVILRVNGWCVTLCCVGQKHNSFSNGNPLTFPTSVLPPPPPFRGTQHPTSPKQCGLLRFNEMQNLNKDANCELWT